MNRIQAFLKQLLLMALFSTLLGACGGSGQDEDLPPPATPNIIREASGLSPAAIQGTINSFRADLGNPDNGVLTGTQAMGRREINWDGVLDSDAAPATLVRNFFNTVEARGLILGGAPGVEFMISADSANMTGTGVRFDNLNGTYDTAFASFSAERLFASQMGNVFEVSFVVPGTATAAAVSGFGAVFTDVDNSGTSSLEFFDRYGRLLFSRSILAAGNTSGSLSFLGVVFNAAAVARVRITMGEAALGPNDITQGGANDLVALDDFVYDEPIALD